MVIMGVTGGYGTGKTTVTGMFKKLGAITVDCDRLVSDLYKPGTIIVKKIARFFGPGILNSNGCLNRGKLAGIIFADTKKRDKINRLVHPAVKRRMLEIIDTCRKKGTAVLVAEVPLLFEAGMEDWFDRIIVVYCSRKRQTQRQGRSRQKEEILLRIKSQGRITEKKQRADFIINNNGPRAETRRQVVRIWGKCR